MGYGIKAVKPTKVVTTTDSLDWNLNTEYPLLKIFGTYTGNVPAKTVGALGHTEITHNLGYPPMTMFYCSYPYGTAGEYFLLTGMTGGCTVSDEVNANTVDLYNLLPDAVPYLIIIFYDPVE